jgi:hypothetical protein
MLATVSQRQTFIDYIEAQPLIRTRVMLTRPLQADRQDLDHHPVITTTRRGSGSGFSRDLAAAERLSTTPLYLGSRVDNKSLEMFGVVTFSGPGRAIGDILIISFTDDVTLT